MRIEAQAPRVLNRAQHDLAGQLDRCLDRIAVIGGKVRADETAQVTFVHGFRAERVLHPEAVGVDEIAARRDLAVSDPAGDQHRDQAAASAGRVVVQRPAGMIADVQAGAPP
jgi:hypothetical protein